MSQRGLEALLKPESIAVIGASEKAGRAGHLMMRNLLAGGFNGPVLPVTPHWRSVCGVMCYPTITDLPLTPDLAILCTHADRNDRLLRQLADKGCKACIILSAPRDQFPALKVLAAELGIRILGPNSLGLISPLQGSMPVSLRCPSAQESWPLSLSLPQSRIHCWTGLTSANSVSLGLLDSATVSILRSMSYWIFSPGTVKPALSCYRWKISTMPAVLSLRHAVLPAISRYW